MAVYGGFVTKWGYGIATVIAPTDVLSHRSLIHVMAKMAYCLQDGNLAIFNGIMTPFSAKVKTKTAVIKKYLFTKPGHRLMYVIYLYVFIIIEITRVQNKIIEIIELTEKCCSPSESDEVLRWGWVSDFFVLSKVERVAERCRFCFS